MKQKTFAKTISEFDRRFDAGEDICDLIDISQATVIRPGKKVRITLDLSEALIRDVDDIRKRIGVETVAPS